MQSQVKCFCRRLTDRQSFKDPGTSVQIAIWLTFSMTVAYIMPQLSIIVSSSYSSIFSSIAKIYTILFNARSIRR